MTNNKKAENTTNNRKEDNTMTNNTKTTQHTNTITKLLRDYEAQTINQTTNQTSKDNYTKALTDLATAVAYSVLKKCISTSQNVTLIQTRKSIARDIQILNRTKYANDNATATTYNANGERKTVILNENLNNELKKLLDETLGDGLDLVNDAVIAILTETNKAKEKNNDNLTIGFMEKQYQERRLNRKVWIQTNESVDGWEDVTTTAIQEVYKAVRRTIENSRAIQTDPRNGYSYLQDIATDSNSGADEVIYKRCGKYADIGGYAIDSNGKQTTYSATEQVANDTETLIEKMNLTTRQAKILQLRQCGYGYKAIATYLGVTHNTIINILKLIQTKAAAIGLKPPTT